MCLAECLGDVTGGAHPHPNPNPNPNLAEGLGDDGGGAPKAGHEERDLA